MTKLWPESVQWWYFPCFLCSWDESSSISSGLSDGSDNLSSEEFNAGSSLNSLPTTPIGSRRNSAIVVIHFNWIEILLSLSVFLLQGLLHQLANLWHTILDRSSLSTQYLLLMGWMCYKPLTALEWESLTQSILIWNLSPQNTDDTVYPTQRQWCDSSLAKKSSGSLWFHSQRWTPM